MMIATGSCSGIENYSRHLTGRQEGELSPYFAEYLPDDIIFLLMNLCNNTSNWWNVQRRQIRKDTWLNLVSDSLHVKIIDL